MKQQTMTILSTEQLNRDIYRTVLQGDTTPVTAPGQFINIRVPDQYLRRPISIADWDRDTMTIIYKVVGRGTAKLAALPVGTSLDVLTGLGNGFDADKALTAANAPSDRAAGQIAGADTESGADPAAGHAEAPRAATPVLIGGGIGVPPLYGLAKALLAKGVAPTVITGFATKDDIILQEEFRQLGIEPVLMTDDGSAGEQGFVTKALDRVLQSGEAGKVRLCACGPEPMLRAVWELCPRGQFSFEARMACGFGACMGCTCKTKYGHKRICKDGPVLEGGEILW